MELFERELHLTQLEDHLRQAAAGHGRVVLVGGEAGVGKTSLVDEFSRLAAAGVAGVLQKSCDALSIPGPLGPIRDLPPVRRGPRVSTRAHPAGLTRREAEVLALVDAGLRNAEIADRLYVTSKTVSHHLSAIYAKLGVATRTDAVRAASQRGITAP
ncbi:MAG: LuxR C-terminal-related transcriptional regulator [Thermomicrobiales bacterium]